MNTDRLTGLLARPALFELLDSRQSGALLYLDTVSLVFSNAVLGPAATDTLLVQTAELLRTTCPHCPVARIGGDEFVVFLDSAKSAPQIAQVLRSKFDAQFAVERASIRAGTLKAGVIDAPAQVPTLRVGVASLADHPDLEAALCAAENSLK